ncbi:MAG: MFS transporter, partial [Chloroflexi bacterium]|nr:MFS transporter [Chloroflexota bacterium]
MRDFLAYPASFWLAFLVSFLSFASLVLLIVPFPIYLNEMGADPVEVGVVIGAFALSSFLSRPVVGRLIDKRGRVPVLILSAAIFTISPLGYLAVNSIPSLLLVRLFHGLSISTGTTAFVTLIADVVPPPKRGEGLGLAAVSIPLALILFPPLGVAIHGEFGFTGVFLAAALIGAIAMLIALVLRKPARHSVDPAELVGNNFLAVARRRPVWVPSLLSMARAAGWGAVVAF